MQNTSQQYPEHRLYFLQILRLLEDYSVEPPIFLFGSVAGCIFVSGYAVLSGRQSVESLRRRRLSLTRQ
jgi:hypothetical protein